MEKVFNLGIPHLGEHILKELDTPELIRCLLVSETWKVLAENVLFKRWKGRLFEACEDGETEIVQLLLDRSNTTIDLHARSGNGMTAIMLACSEGYDDIVKLFLDHSDKNMDLNKRGHCIVE